MNDAHPGNAASSDSSACQQAAPESLAAALSPRDFAITLTAGHGRPPRHRPPAGWTPGLGRNPGPGEISVASPLGRPLCTALDHRRAGTRATVLARFGAPGTGGRAVLFVGCWGRTFRCVTSAGTAHAYSPGSITPPSSSTTAPAAEPGCDPAAAGLERG